MECKVVCGFLPNYVPAIAAAVGGISLADHRTGHGIHGSTICRYLAPCFRGVPLFSPLGDPSGGVIWRAGKRLPRLRKLPGLLRGATGDYLRSAHLPERLTIPL